MPSLSSTEPAPEIGRAHVCLPAGGPPRPPPARPSLPPAALQLHSARIDRLIDADDAFTELYGTSTRAFWLDSARVEPGLSRFSFLGDASGPTGEVLTFRVGPLAAPRK